VLVSELADGSDAVAMAWLLQQPAHCQIEPFGLTPSESKGIAEKARPVAVLHPARRVAPSTASYGGTATFSKTAQSARAARGRSWVSL